MSSTRLTAALDAAGADHGPGTGGGQGGSRGLPDPGAGTGDDHGAPLHGCDFGVGGSGSWRSPYRCRTRPFLPSGTLSVRPTVAPVDRRMFGIPNICCQWGLTHGAGQRAGRDRGRVGIRGHGMTGLRLSRHPQVLRSPPGAAWPRPRGRSGFADRHPRPFGEWQDHPAPGGGRLRAGRPGPVEIGGRVVDDGRRSVPPEKRGIGYVPQDGALFPHLTVAANVSFGRSRLFRRRSDADGPPPCSRWSVSPGARPLPARALRRPAAAGGPGPGPGRRASLVLLDEPFSSLDASLRAAVRAEVLQILRDGGVTAVLVTHDQDEALSVADQVAVIRDGVIGQSGTPHDLYDHPVDPAMARFLGDANLVPATVDGDRVTTPFGHLQLRPHPEAAVPRGRAVALIRPEQMVAVHRARRGGPAGRGHPPRVPRPRHGDHPGPPGRGGRRPAGRPDRGRPSRWPTAPRWRSRPTGRPWPGPPPYRAERPPVRPPTGPCPPQTSTTDDGGQSHQPVLGAHVVHGHPDDGPAPVTPDHLRPGLDRPDPGRMQVVDHRVSRRHRTRGDRRPPGRRPRRPGRPRLRRGGCPTGCGAGPRDASRVTGPRPGSMQKNSSGCARRSRGAAWEWRAAARSRAPGRPGRARRRS